MKYKNIFLKGKKIYLRPLTFKDINNRYLSWLNENTNGFIPAAVFPNTKYSVREYLKKNLENPNVIFLSICDIENDLHIGNIKIGPISWINRNTEFGRLIGDKKYRKKGVGKEVVKLTLNYLFSKLNMHKVYASCLKINLAAIKSNRKCGMKIEAILKEKLYHKNKFHDQVLLSIKKSSWQKFKKNRN